MDPEIFVRWEGGPGNFYIGGSFIETIALVIFQGVGSGLIINLINREGGQIPSPLG